MATACHPMGLIHVVTLVVLCVVAIGAHAARRAVAIAASAWLLVGVGLASLPWMLFAYAGWEDAVGQQRLVQHRWNLADPRFYAWNAVLEWRRYISVGRGPQFGIPGAWLLAFCSVTGAAALAFGPWRTRSAAHARRCAPHRIHHAHARRARQVLLLSRRTVALDRPDRGRRDHDRRAIDLAPRAARRLVALDADVVLVDQAMIDYIRRGPREVRVHGPGARNPGAEDLERFLGERTARRIDLADPSYGRFEIRFLRPAAHSRLEPTR
jgi:hypothetical protein